ncbi:hypothetical protein D9M69_543370 [compost metagenome]
MFLAHTTDGRRISATRDEPGYCPSCNEALTAKLGDIYVWHWSHKPGQACDYRKATTLWQYGWMSHYHSSGWTIEATIAGVEFDGVHDEKRLSLKLATKLDAQALDEFVEASAKEGLKPVIIFHPKAFVNFDFRDSRFCPKRRSNNHWVFFWKHAHLGEVKRSATLWMDIDEDALPSYGLTSGMYNLSYSAKFFGDIVVNPTPKPKSMTRHSRPVDIDGTQIRL